MRLGSIGTSGSLRIRSTSSSLRAYSVSVIESSCNSSCNVSAVFAVLMNVAPV